MQVQISGGSVLLLICGGTDCLWVTVVQRYKYRCYLWLMPVINIQVQIDDKVMPITLKLSES